MVQRKRSASSSRRGATAVEFALVLPFLMFLFVLAIDYARVFYYGIILENCARNGAYFASNYPNSSYLYNDIYGYKSLDEAIYSDSVNVMKKGESKNTATYQVNYSYTLDGSFTPAPTPTGFVKVTMKWDFKTITQFPGVPGTVALERSVIMKMAPVMPSF
jgi:Flp pilus assembly protein TadG